MVKRTFFHSPDNGIAQGENIDLFKYLGNLHG